MKNWKIDMDNWYEKLIWKIDMKNWYEKLTWKVKKVTQVYQGT